MKKLFIFILLMGLMEVSQAQKLIQSFDNAVGSFFPDPPVSGENFFTNGPTSQFNLANDPEHFEGTGSMKIDYRIEAADGWGGYIVRTTYTGTVPNAPPYIDLSTGTHLKFRYKVLTPAVTSQDSAVFMEFKLAEYDEAGAGRDLWLHHAKMDFFDVSGNWIEVTMPLKRDADNTQGFVLQFGDGDNELQLDKIKGFEFALVYLSQPNGNTATGSILIDKLELVGNRYNPFQTFDNAATDVFSVDNMSWAGAGAGSVTLSDNTTDFVEGTGAMQFDYTVNASQDWGGYLNMTDTTFVLDSNFAERTALALYVKNVNPLTGTTAERVTMRFFLMENSTGANEDWVIEVPINFEQAGEWTRYYLPLKMDTVWTDGNGKTRFPQNGFAQPWWNQTGDKTFNQDFVAGYKIELSAGGNDYGPKGETFTGRLLFDVLQQSGFQYADDVAPLVPANILAIQGSFTNLVTWEDVPGEANEKYTVYASMQPITDLTSPNVDIIASNISGGAQVEAHVLLSPSTNQNVTYYYAVVCKDLAGNIGDPGFSAPVTNLAKGVTVISEVVPAFNADGDLSEWQSIPHFRMYSSDGSGTVSQNFTITNDADCSADVWVAIDKTYLYVAFKINDDIFVPTGAFNSWELDSPDMFIGLYDWKSAMHTTYLRGSTPDYQIRFNEGVARNDDYTCEYDSLLVEGPNYYYGELFPTGYVVEARISLNDLATLRKRPDDAIDTINVHAGDRIPIDFGINDNDGTSREGLLFYSSRNNDAGHYNPSVWSYTWLTDWVVEVENEGELLVNKFNLAQNYPNPFNPATQIQYSIAKPGLVSIKVFDILGRQVADLVNKQQSAGSYTVDFNAQSLSTGVYFYRIESGSFQASKKMILIK